MAANNSVFQIGDELIVDKTRANILGSINTSQWKNTGRYWARGTEPTKRTTMTRGTHKVFETREKEIKKAKAKAERDAHKAKVNGMQHQLASFGLIPNPSERMRIRNSNGSLSYASKLKGLTNEQLLQLEKNYQEQNRLNAEVAELMGDLTMGGRKKRHTKRRTIHRRKTHKTRRHHRK
jgi:hypothetical protein